MSGRAPRRGGAHSGSISGPQPEPAATGSKKAVWNHDFLNKKPWHPLNRQNQARIFEAEQEYLDRKKRDDAAKAEFEAEQQYLETLAHLPGRQADKYRQMQGVSWMYIKPPGLEGQQDYRTHDGGPEARASQEEQKPVSDSRQPHARPTEPGTAVTTEVAAPPERRRGPLKREERGQGTARALAVRFQRRAASPPIGGAAVGAECHELVAEDAVDTDAMLAALLQREERAGSVDESADEGAKGGAAMRTTPHESGERIRGDGEARGMRDRDRTRQRERSGRKRRSDKHRDAGMSSDDGGEQRGADGRGRSGGDEKVACERKRSRRGDVGSDSGDSDCEDRKKRRRSHKGKGKHRSKDRRHKAEHRSGPRGSVELQEAIEYLIGQGVDVSQIVKGARGYHVWNAMPCPDVCVSSATRAARMLTTVPAVHLSTDNRPTQTKTR